MNALVQEVVVEKVAPPDVVTWHQMAMEVVRAQKTIEALERKLSLAYQIGDKAQETHNRVVDKLLEKIHEMEEVEKQLTFERDALEMRVYELEHPEPRVD